MPEFTHIDKKGHVRMVNVTDKIPSLRTAKANGMIKVGSEILGLIENHRVKKGNVLETARIAGIMAAKKTSQLIPMCHPINITHVGIEFFIDKPLSAINIEATVQIKGITGVEMEALTAVSVAALTIYDMCKSYNKNMTITNIHLLEKSGGKSGDFVRTDDI